MFDEVINNYRTAELRWRSMTTGSCAPETAYTCGYINYNIIINIEPVGEKHRLERF